MVQWGGSEWYHESSLNVVGQAGSGGDSNRKVPTATGRKIEERKIMAERERRQFYPKTKLSNPNQSPNLVPIPCLYMLLSDRYMSMLEFLREKVCYSTC